MLALHIVGKFFKWLFIVLFTCIIFGCITAFFMLNHAKTYVEDVIMPMAEAEQSLLQNIAYDASQSSTMYYTDANGQLVEMKTLFAKENRIWVTLDEMPDDLIKATVAIEDKRFWEHEGVDWRRTGAAVLYMFTGRDVQGGSTITQQLIKNVTTNNDVTVQRKVLEIFTALEYDANTDKEVILENYLNVIYLGRRCNGVYTAAKTYFDKEVSELTLAECACLISITNNPSLYDPFNHRDNNLKRASTVIREMHKQGYIDEERQISVMAELGWVPTGERDENGYLLFEYRAETATIQFNYGAVEDSNNASGNIDSWYVDAVIDAVTADLMAQYDLTKEAASNLLFSGGLSIYTCFDPEIQAMVDEVYTNPDNFDGYESRNDQPLLSAITVVDNATGRVVALGDSREKTGNRLQINAVDALRQPGSAIKPIAVYAPALEEGLITPYSAVDDSPFYIDEAGKPYPPNSNRKYSGLTSIYKSVTNSYNTSSVKTADLVGLQTCFDYMEDVFGITTLTTYYEAPNGETKSDIDYSPMAMGGLTWGVTTYEMAGAYSVFPRNGTYIKPHLYTQVVDSEGNVLLSNDETGEVVLSEKTCYYVNTMLEGVVTSGTGTKARIKGMTAAGKTGTTNSKFDLWFCGYTGYYTAAVWTGYEYSETINFSGNASAILWQKVMSRLVEGKEDVDLNATDLDIKKVSYCTKSGLRATEACTLGECSATGYFVAEDVPTEYCEVHTTAKVCLDCAIGGPYPENYKPKEDEVLHYHLAGEFCPEESVVEIAVIQYEREQDIVEAVKIADEELVLAWLEELGPCTLHTAEWQEEMLLRQVQNIEVSSTSITKTVGDPAFNLMAKSVDGMGDPGGVLTYRSSNSQVATVDAYGNITILGSGTANITITAEATEFAPAVSVTVSIIVNEQPSGGGEGDHWWDGLIGP